MQIHVNYLAVLVAAVASFALGGLWYGPLFGKAWAKAQGMGEMKPSGAEIGRAFALNILGLLLMSWVLAHHVVVWMPTKPPGAPDVQLGLAAGFFNWLGFVVPMLLNSVAFEKKSWKVFGINAGYQVISLLVMGVILAVWH
jgi:hypothetical protein